MTHKPSLSLALFLFLSLCLSIDTAGYRNLGIDSPSRQSFRLRFTPITLRRRRRIPLCVSQRGEMILRLKPLKLVAIDFRVRSKRSAYIPSDLVEKIALIIDAF